MRRLEEAVMMHNKNVVRRKGAWGVWLAVLVLAGCAAGSRPFHEGRELLERGEYAQGFAKLEEAVRLEPRRAEYRIALSSQRATIVAQQNSLGEAALRDGRLTEAEEAYRRVLEIDPQNAMARQGQMSVVSERRHRQTVAEAEALLKKGEAADLRLALERLRPVLAENPSHRQAMGVRARVQEQLAKQPKVGDRLAEVYQKPITLEFRDAPLKAVFDVIAKVSGLNFFFDRDVRPDLKATILARNTSIEDAV